MKFQKWVILLFCCVISIHFTSCRTEKASTDEAEVQQPPIVQETHEKETVEPEIRLEKQEDQEIDTSWLDPYNRTVKSKNVAWDIFTKGTIWSSVVVINDTVYAGSKGDEGENILYAVHRLTGNTIWKSLLPGRITEPAYASNMLFTGCLGGFFALDKINGEILWKIETPGIAWSSPAVHQTTVFASTYASGSMIPKEVHMLYALDTSSGREKWKFNADSRIMSPPALIGEHIIISTQDGAIIALDLATGRERWRYSTASTIWATPITDGNLIFVGLENGEAFAFFAYTGHKAWSYASEQSIWASVAVNNTMVFLRTGETLTALDKTLGQKKWSVTIGSAGMRSAPAANESTVFIRSMDYLHAIDAASGNEKWKVEAGGAVQSNLAVMDNTVYFGSGVFNGQIIAMQDKIHD